MLAYGGPQVYVGSFDRICHELSTTDPEETSHDSSAVSREGCSHNVTIWTGDVAVHTPAAHASSSGDKRTALGEAGDAPASRTVRAEG